MEDIGSLSLKSGQKSLSHPRAKVSLYFHISTSSTVSKRKKPLSFSGSDTVNFVFKIVGGQDGAAPLWPAGFAESLAAGSVPVILATRQPGPPDANFSGWRLCPPWTRLSALLGRSGGPGCGGEPQDGLSLLLRLEDPFCGAPEPSVQLCRLNANSSTRELKARNRGLEPRLRLQLENTFLHVRDEEEDEVCARSDPGSSDASALRLEHQASAPLNRQTSGGESLRTLDTSLATSFEGTPSLSAASQSLTSTSGRATNDESIEGSAFEPQLQPQHTVKKPWAGVGAAPVSSVFSSRRVAAEDEDEDEENAQREKEEVEAARERQWRQQQQQQQQQHAAAPPRDDFLPETAAAAAVRHHSAGAGAGPHQMAPAGAAAAAAAAAAEAAATAAWAHCGRCAEEESGSDGPPGNARWFAQTVSSPAPPPVHPALNVPVSRDLTTSSARATPEELFDAVTRGDVVGVREVISRTEDLNRTTEQGSHVLFRAVMKCESVEVLRLLLDAGADIHAEDARGNSVMHFWARATASPQRLWPIGQALLQAGANVNAQRSFDGMSPLHHVVAAQRNRKGWLCILKAEFLLQNGADPCLVVDGTGERPIDLLSASRLGESTSRLRTLLQVAGDAAQRARSKERANSKSSAPSISSARV